MVENLTDKVVEKLRTRYKDDLLLEQFSWPLEGSAYGHADAIGISLHPSRSTNIEYYEIKNSRQDWLNELKHPKKADGLAQHCDKIWLLTTTEDIASLEEIPENWGWMFLNSRQLKIKKEAPKLQPIFDRDFLIRVAQYSKREFNREIYKARDEAYKEAKLEISSKQTGEYWKEQAERWEKAYKIKQEQEEVFQKESGLDWWKGIKKIKRYGQLVKALAELEETQSEISQRGLRGLGWDFANLKEQIITIESSLKKIKSSKLEVD